MGVRMLVSAADWVSAAVTIRDLGPVVDRSNETEAKAQAA